MKIEEDPKNQNLNSDTKAQMPEAIRDKTHVFVGLLAEHFIATLVAANDNCDPNAQKDTCS